MREIKIIRIFGVLLISLSFFFILLIIDSEYLNSSIFGFFSGDFSYKINNYFGVFSVMFLSVFSLTGILLNLNLNPFNKMSVISGFLLFTFLLPILFGGSQDVSGLNSGVYGITLSRMLSQNGFLSRFVILFLWMALSLFLLLLPIKTAIVLFIVKILKIEKNIVLKEKSNVKKDTLLSDSKLNEEVKTVKRKKYEDFKKKSETNNLPWVSKIVYESYDKRIETPIFPPGEGNVKKFKLQSKSEEAEEFDEVDTLSDSVVKEECNKTDEYINLHKIDNDVYYQKVKEYWPQEWKENKRNKEEIEVLDFDTVEDFRIYDESYDDDLNDSKTEHYNNSDLLEHESISAEPYLLPDNTENSDSFNGSEVILNLPSLITGNEDEADDLEDYNYFNEPSDDNYEEEAAEFTDQYFYDTENDESDDIEDKIINHDDIKKFLDVKTFNYLNEKKLREVENKVDYHDEIDEDDICEDIDSESYSVFPNMEILEDVTEVVDSDEYRRIENEDANILESTLGEFGIKAEVCDIVHGPVVTLFKIVPAPGIRLSKIESLSDNLALRLAAQSIRIIAPIPGEKVVGIEVPNKKRELVSFKEVVNSSSFTNNKFNIPIGIGKDISGNIIVIDLPKMPHVLIAGATGAGKSVCVNVFLSSILFSRSPDDVRLILIDPKIVELQPYDGIPHLLTPVITDSKDAINALKYLVYEMEQRYALLGKIGVRDISEYRELVKTGNLNFTNMPYIVAFVDEFADLMSTSGKEAEMLFARLTAKARAIGIHMILATQRPSTDVITGLIKSNVPARFAFQVISYQDSRIILDQKGAEKLLGQGDMLYLSPTQPFPVRLQGAYLGKEEVDLIAEHWKNIAEPEYIDLAEILGLDEEEDLFTSGERAKDPLFAEAVEIVKTSKKASASYLQRRMNIGYNRAARMIEEMEEMGIVGPMQGSKPRDILQ